MLIWSRLDQACFAPLQCLAKSLSALTPAPIQHGHTAPAHSTGHQVDGGWPAHRDHLRPESVQNVKFMDDDRPCA